jgi:hypothetical protein
MMFRNLAAAAALLATVSAANAADPVLTYEQRKEAILRLNWARSGTYELPASHSTIAMPEGYVMVTGADAGRLLVLLGDPRMSAEAVLVRVTRQPRRPDHLRQHQ